jgi:hypothetical protein
MKKITVINCTFLTLFVLFLGTTLFNCSSEKTEEELVFESIDEIGTFAEKRDIDGILSYISVDYNDDEDRTLDEIEELIQQYFSQFRGIVVSVLAKKMELLSPPDATLVVEVALSSGAAKMFRKAVPYSGRFYRFNVDMIKEGKKWRVKKAAWKDISIAELDTASAKILKELFPNSM